MNNPIKLEVPVNDKIVNIEVTISDNGAVRPVEPKPEPIEPIEPPVSEEPNKPTPKPPIEIGEGVYEEDLAENNPQSTPNNIFIPRGVSEFFNVSYKGAFQVKASNDISTSAWAVGRIGYCEKRHSLFLAGHAQHNCVAEFKIPENLGLVDQVKELPNADVLQNFIKVLDKKTTGNKTNRINGFLCVDDALLVTSEIWYDAPGTNEDNLQVFTNSSDLVSSDYKGMLQLEDKARSAGYMSHIPVDVQEEFNNEYLTGWPSVSSIISRYSVGPSLYTFAPEDAINSESLKVPATKHLCYPHGKDTKIIPGLQQGEGVEISPVWGFLAKGVYGFIIPNTRIFMVLGSHGGLHSGIGYKITQDNGRKTGGYATYKHLDNYNYFWLYDIDDILTADESHEPLPFSYGKWSHPFDDKGQHKVSGASFDHKNNTLYVCLTGAGQTGKYDRVPLIIAYEVKAK